MLEYDSKIVSSGIASGDVTVILGTHNHNLVGAKPSNTNSHSFYDALGSGKSQRSSHGILTNPCQCVTFIGYLGIARTLNDRCRTSQSGA